MASFVRWNETTHIWEKSSDPNNPSAAWNNLPLQKLIIGEGADTGLPLQVRQLGQAVSLSVTAHSNVARYYARGDDPLTPTYHYFYIRDGISSGVDKRIIGLGPSGIFSEGQFYSNGPLTVAGAIQEHNRVTPLGEWTEYTPIISSPSFTISGGTSFGRYALMGKTMIVMFTISAATVSGSNPASQQEAHISLPLPIAVVNGSYMSNVINYHDGSQGLWKTSMAYFIGGEDRTRCQTNYGNGACYLWGTVIVPIS